MTSRAEVSGFVHHPGRNCGATALSNVARHFGHPFSEGLCFGLGAGLDFIFTGDAALSPSRVTLGRSASLEEPFFAILGSPRRFESSPVFPGASLCQALANGWPVILLTDLSHLPYWETRRAYTGHSVVLTGLDLDAGWAHVADTHWQGIREVPLSALLKATQSDHPPFPVQNHHLVLPPFNVPDLASVIPTAIRRVVVRMLYAQATSSGVAGIRRFADDLRQWHLVPDGPECSRYAFQTIERRGTGGGLFRRLYAEFLSEAEVICPSLKPLGLPGQLEEAALRWTRLAQDLREASRFRHPAAYERLCNQVLSLADLEERVFRHLDVWSGNIVGEAV